MADVAPPSFKKRSNKSTNLRKRPATPPTEDALDSESDYTSDEEAGVRVKRRKKDGVAVSSLITKSTQDFSKATKYSADRTSMIAANEDATKASNWYSEAADAAEAAKLTARAQREVNEDEDANGAYKGTAKYSTFIQKHPGSASRQVGPVKAATNVRTITVTDFAPDVCKDYKQTGFCGFGDNCKFLHAREDYKQGWQLDKEWESAGSKAKKNGAAGKGSKDDMDEEEKVLEGIPFACAICKESYKRPVVTKCGHYFCEKCAMGRYMKDRKRTCAACGSDTGGTFGNAKKLGDLLERKRARAEERRKADEGGVESGGGVGEG